MKLKLAVAILLTSLFFLALEFRIPNHSIISALTTPTKNPNKNTTIIDNVALTAVREQNNWSISLKPGHFHKKNSAQSFAIIYNDIFYGVFLLTDRIYLPVLVKSDVDITITSLDDEGRPLSSESYTLGESHALSSPP